jgi:hypothetical protein
MGPVPGKRRCNCMKKLFAAFCKTIAEYRVDFAACNGLR